MLTNNTVLALFKDSEDETLCSPLLTRIAGIVRMVAGEDPAASFKNLKVLGIEPALIIISARLYPAARLDLVSNLRNIFPGTEFLVISSAADPFPPLKLLAADMVRHLAINPAGSGNGNGDMAKSWFLPAVHNLVERRSWDMADYLKPGTPIQEFAFSSSEQKEALIAELETLIRGESPDADLLRQKGALLADEMLENAMYGAPRGADDHKIYRKGEKRAIFPREGISFRFGFDGETLAMEVTDGWGSLSPDMVLKHLAQNQDRRELSDDTGGRGLFIIWRILDHFHVSITPGRQTVVGGHLRASSPMDLETPRGFHIATHAENSL
ncbi:MAG: ATP-binding protein [Geobacteraceae bacterium]|nr:ATP-binding protein [Geobacteraceae bacterium]